MTTAAQVLRAAVEQIAVVSLPAGDLLKNAAQLLSCRPWIQEVFHGKSRAASVPKPSPGGAIRDPVAPGPERIDGRTGGRAHRMGAGADPSDHQSGTAL